MNDNVRDNARMFLAIMIYKGFISEERAIDMMDAMDRVMLENQRTIADKVAPIFGRLEEQTRGSLERAAQLIIAARDTQGAANAIQMFFHCAQCIEEKPDNVAPREWAQLEAGWTEKGLQVWCRRHEVNVIHIDFLGQKVGTVGK